MVVVELTIMIIIILVVLFESCVKLADFIGTLRFIDLVEAIVVRCIFLVIITYLRDIQMSLILGKIMIAIVIYISSRCWLF